MPKLELSTNSGVIGAGTGLAYSYLRVSTIKQGDEGEGLTRQGKLIREFCARHNLKEAGVIRDKGLSAFHRAHRRKG